MSKQDGYASRTPADLERKYKFGETFAEVFGLVSDARKIAEEAQSAIEGLDQEQIFNLLTNNGKAQGVYRDDNGDVYVNASFIKSGKLAAEYIDATNLKVNAANITGTLTIGQLPSNVAKTSDLSGFVDEATVTTITNNAIKTLTITAEQISGGTITGVTLISSDDWYDDVEIGGGEVKIGTGSIGSYGNHMQISNQNGIHILSYDSVTIEGQVFIQPLYSAYHWEFTEDGIYLKNGLGDIVRRVTLEL